MASVCHRPLADDLHVEVDHLSPSGWEETVGLFDDATYDQTHVFAEHNWGGERLSHVTVALDGRLAGAAQAVVLTPPGLARGLAYVKFGPLWRRKGEAPDPVALASILAALQREYAVRRGHMLTLLPPPDAEHGDLWRKLLHEAGFSQRRHMDDPNRYHVNLALDAEQLRASLSQKWRAHLKKASAAALKFTSGRDGAHFSAFSRLHDQMTARKGFSDGDALAAVPKMIARLPEAMRPGIVLAWHHGEPTAGAIVGRIGEVAQYLFGATDERALALRAGYALQWRIIEEQRRDGARWYDLGGEVGSQGLRQFKKGLVGREGAVVELPGEWDFWTDPVGRYAADAMFALRRAKATLHRFRQGRQAE